MPANACVDDRDSGLLQFHSKKFYFFPRASAFNQIEHGQPENDNELITGHCPCATHYFKWQAHSVFIRTAPLIGALIGARCNELIDQISFAAHEFNSVVASILSQFRAAGKIIYGAFNLIRTQRTRSEYIDRSLNGRCRYTLIVRRIASGVENLQTDLALMHMHRVSDDLMIWHQRFIHEHGCAVP